jgi:hypothetical protein
MAPSRRYPHSGPSTSILVRAYNLAAETGLPYLRIPFSLLLILIIFGKLYVEPRI